MGTGELARAERGRLARLWYGKTSAQILVLEQGLRPADSSPDDVVLFTDMTRLARVKPNLLWATLEVDLASGTRTFCGFGEPELLAVADVINRVIVSRMRARLKTDHDVLKAVVAEIDELQAQDARTTSSRIEAVLAAAVAAPKLATDALGKVCATAEHRQDAATVFRFVHSESQRLAEVAWQENVDRAHTRFAAEFTAQKAAVAQISDLLSGKTYVRATQVGAVLAIASRVPVSHTDELWDLHATKEQKETVALLSSFVHDSEQLANHANAQHVGQQLEHFAELFDTIESSPLTRAQREACVVNEDNNLVLAGAGTGKTSTMVGRAGYLMASGQAKPGQILMLAYGNKAAGEMQERQDERLAKLCDQGTPKIKTFHALGLEIIGKATGTKPSITPLIDAHALEKFIDERLSRLCADPDYVSYVLAWCFNRRFPYGNPFDFKSMDDYLEYVRTNELRTLKGELVKSYEELVIANFLNSNGVEYEYEKKYKIPTDFVEQDENGAVLHRETDFLADEDHRSYMPDFYLPGPDVYLEHFALNGEMKPPESWVNYANGVKWKRETHKHYGTRLLETRSHMQYDGVLVR